MKPGSTLKRIVRQCRSYAFTQLMRQSKTLKWLLVDLSRWQGLESLPYIFRRSRLEPRLAIQDYINSVVGRKFLAVQESVQVATAQRNVPAIKAPHALRDAGSRADYLHIG